MKKKNIKLTADSRQAVPNGRVPKNADVVKNTDNVSPDKRDREH